MTILKLFHVLFIFIWIGSLLSVSRQMASRAKEPPSIQLKLAALYKRTYFYMDLPSMIIAVICGVLLFFFNGVNFKAPWLHMKLTFAFLLIVCDVICGFLVVKSTKVPLIGKGIGYKIFHGIIGVLLILVLFSIYVLKPLYT